MTESTEHNPMRRFLFETSFDEEVDGALSPPPEPEPAPAPPEPTFSEQELALARQAAFAEGARAGRDEARAENAAAAAALTANMDAAMQTLAARQSAALDDCRRQAAKIAQLAMRKALPGACAKNALNEIEWLMTTCLEMVLKEPSIVVKVHDSMLDEAKTRIEAIAASRAYEGRIVFLADDALGVDGCRIEWADGGAVRDSAALADLVDEAFARASALGDAASRPPASAAALDQTVDETAQPAAAAAAAH